MSRAGCADLLDRARDSVHIQAGQRRSGTSRRPDDVGPLMDDCPAVTRPSSVEAVDKLARGQDLDIEWVDQPEPRGTAHETWQRARGWSSED